MFLHSFPPYIMECFSVFFLDLFLDFGSFCPLYVSHPLGITQWIQLAKNNNLFEKLMFGGLWIQILSGINFTPADLKWTTQLTTFHLHTFPSSQSSSLSIINPIIIITPSHFLTLFHSLFLFPLQPVTPPPLSATTLFKVELGKCYCATTTFLGSFPT